MSNYKGVGSPPLNLALRSFACIFETVLVKSTLSLLLQALEIQPVKNEMPSTLQIHWKSSFSSILESIQYQGAGWNWNGICEQCFASQQQNNRRYVHRAEQDTRLMEVTHLASSQGLRELGI